METILRGPLLAFRLAGFRLVGKRPVSIPSGFDRPGADIKARA